jgi:DNA-binding NarL/FixJ family response regulator
MNIKVIMLTVENDSKFVYDSIHTGADGYILKESAGEEIVNAIKSVYYGDKFIDKSLVSILFSNIQKKERKDSKTFNSLSKREVEVLYFISKGLSNKEIGKKLFLSEKTVKNYATNIFKKINVGDRVQATIFAIENQINEYFSENRD